MNHWAPASVAPGLLLDKSRAPLRRCSYCTRRNRKRAARYAGGNAWVSRGSRGSRGRGVRRRQAARPAAEPIVPSISTPPRQSQVSGPEYLPLSPRVWADCGSLCPMTRARCAALVGRIGSTGYLRWTEKILSKRGDEFRGCPLDGGRAKIVEGRLRRHARRRLPRPAPPPHEPWGPVPPPGPTPGPSGVSARSARSTHRMKHRRQSQPRQ